MIVDSVGVIKNIQVTQVPASLPAFLEKFTYVLNFDLYAFTGIKLGVYGGNIYFGKNAGRLAVKL
jgi:hypothetical protein